MIQRRTVGVLAGVGLLLSSTSSFAYFLDFTMINNSNQPIVEFMASSTRAASYIGFHDVYVPAAGGQQGFHFVESGVGDDCYVDMKMKFQGGQYWFINHVNL